MEAALTAAFFIARGPCVSACLVTYGLVIWPAVYAAGGEDSIRRLKERKHLMNTIYRYAAVLGRVVKSRLFGAAALAVASAVLVMSVSVNMHAITVIDGENSKVVFTMNNDDPHAVLTAAGVALSEGDEVRSDIENIRGEIEINRAFDVQITADGISTVVRMTGGTVNDVLERTGIEVREDDMLSHLPETTVTDGMNITVERVGYNEYTRTEAIPYETTLKYTNVIPKGSTKLKQAGKKGEKTYVYRERIVDGEVVETVLVSETVTQKPVNAVKLVGTVVGTPLSKAPFDIELDEAGQPVNYKQVFTGTCTAYTCDGGRLSGVTATGMKPQVGVVAVNPKKIPYGSKLYITSADGSYVYGYAIAGDTGGGVMKGTLIADLYMDTYEECIQFGKRRNVKVFVLE